MTWYVGTSPTSKYLISDMEILRSNDSANSASFSCLQAYSMGSSVIIYRDTTPVFQGEVYSLDWKNKAWKYVVKESATILQNFRLDGTDDSGIVDISNPDGTKTITEIVSEILSYSDGWTDGSENTSPTIPDSSPAKTLPPLRFNNANVASALNKFLVDICGFKMWFDGATKVVEYGNYRADLTASNIISYNLDRSHSNINYDVDRVIVKGRSSDIIGKCIKSGATTPYKTVIYRYLDCNSEEEAEALAEKILDVRGSSSNRFEFRTASNFWVYREGDYISVNDSETGITGYYVIQDITIYESFAIIGIGSAKKTILSILGNALQQIDGDSFEGVQNMWYGGWDWLMPHDAKYPNLSYVDVSDYGKWVMPVLDKEYIGDVTLTVGVDCYKSLYDIQTNNANIAVTTTGTTGQAIDGTCNVTNADGTVTVDVNNMEACATSIGFKDGDYSETGISLLTGSWVDLIEINVDSLLSDMQFGLITFNMSVGPNTSGAKVLSVKALKYNGSSWLAAHTVSTYLLISASAIPQILSSSILLPFDSDAENVTKYKLQAEIIQGSSASVKVYKSVAAVQRIGSHTHLTSVGDVEVIAQDDGHGHILGLDDHDHMNTDSGHGHNTVPYIDNTNVYPENLDVYLINSIYPAGSGEVGGKKLNASTLSVGGMRKEFTFEISASDLDSGNNYIRVYSTQYGACEVYASFVTYGV